MPGCAERSRTLLEAGADIRVIQEILGRALLTTTQIYTRVAVNRLKVVHDACHPGAKLDGGRRERGAAGESSSTDGSGASGDERSPAVRARGRGGGGAGRG